MKYRVGGPVLSLVLLAGLGACATAGGPPPRGGPGPRGPGGEGPPRPAAPQLFISPAGQPFRAAPGDAAPLGQWWAQADRDADGVLTREELVADALAFFETLDVERDGALDGVEVTRYERQVVPEILQGVRQDGGGGGGGGARPHMPDGGRGRGGPSEAGPRGGPGGEGPPRSGADGRGGRKSGSGGPPPVAREGAARWMLLNDPQPIMSADSDWSRRVTREEFRKKAEIVFKTLDANHDGRLTREELPPLPPQRGGGPR